MKQNRFFFYAVMINMVTNIIVYVPHILFTGLFDGALMSILVSVVIGMTLMILFSKSLEQFPRQTLPEILQRVFPHWLVVLITGFLASFWFVAGAIVLLAFSAITTRYLSPETGQLTVLTFYALAVLMIIPIKTSRLLGGIEALFLISIPLIFLILIKSVTEKNMEWEDILDVCTHLVNAPTVTLVAAATYIFTGYVNMVILHQENALKLKTHHFVLIGAFGFLTLLTSFFIPIGRLGEFAVNRYLFPWVPTADSVSMQYFVIERLMIPFLLVYLMVALVSAVLHWHVGYKLFLAPLRQERKWHGYLLRALFGVTLLVIRYYMHDENLLYDLASYWLVARFFCEIGLVVLMVYLAKRGRRHEQQV